MYKLFGLSEESSFTWIYRAYEVTAINRLKDLIFNNIFVRVTTAQVFSCSKKYDVAICMCSFLHQCRFSYVKANFLHWSLLCNAIIIYYTALVIFYKQMGDNWHNWIFKTLPKAWDLSESDKQNCEVLFYSKLALKKGLFSSNFSTLDMYEFIFFNTIWKYLCVFSYFLKKTIVLWSDFRILDPSNLMKYVTLILNFLHALNLSPMSFFDLPNTFKTPPKLIKNTYQTTHPQIIF